MPRKLQIWIEVWFSSHAEELDATRNVSDIIQNGDLITYLNNVEKVLSAWLHCINAFKKFFLIPLNPHDYRRSSPEPCCVSRKKIITHNLFLYALLWNYIVTLNIKYNLTKVISICDNPAAYWN